MGISVTRVQDAHGHGWYLGSPRRWALAIGEHDAWPSAWERHTLQTGIALTDLHFDTTGHRNEFVRDIGL